MYGARNGLTAGQVDRRGRWRNSKRVGEQYIAINLPYSDALAAAKLAGPEGAIEYKKKSRGAEYITDTLLLQDVAPKIYSVFGRQLAITLGTVLVWGAIQGGEDSEFTIPSVLKNRTTQAIRQKGGNVDINPIDKIPIHISRERGEVHLVELNASKEANLTSEVYIGTVAGSTVQMQELRAVQSSVLSTKRGLEGMHTHSLVSQLRFRNDIFRRLSTIEKTTKRIAIQPVIRSTPRETVGESLQSNTQCLVKLSSRPKDLYVLWHEFEVGYIQKAAKHFTSKERGHNRYAYSRRKVFWDAAKLLTLRGHTSDSAVDMIYERYGRGLGVTVILKKMSCVRKERNLDVLEI